MIKLSLLSGESWSDPVYVAGIDMCLPRPGIIIRQEPCESGPNFDSAAAILDEIVSDEGPWTGYRLEQGGFVREVVA